MLLTQLLIFTLCQTGTPAAKTKQPQVEIGEVHYSRGEVSMMFLTFPQAPKKGGHVLVLVPSSGRHAELVITEVKRNEIEGFDISFDLAPLELKVDAKLEYSHQDLVMIYPVPTVVPALVKLNPETCPKMIHQSQVQACLDMDLDGKPDLLLADCCGKGYAFDEDKQIYCNDSLTSQCLWRWQGKAWKLVYKHDPC